jgi:hypothetical protein
MRPTIQDFADTLKSLKEKDANCTYVIRMLHTTPSGEVALVGQHEATSSLKKTLNKAYAMLNGSANGFEVYLVSNLLRDKFRLTAQEERSFSQE